MNIYNMLTSIGLSTIVVALIGFIIYFAMNIDKFEALGAFISKLFAKKSRRAEKKFIQLDIQSKIDGFCKLLRKETGLLEKKGITIKWIDTKEIDRDAFFKNGELILVMCPHDAQEKNIVNATLAFIRKGTLWKARGYIDYKVEKGVDFTLAKKIFCQDQSCDCLDYFTEMIVIPELKKSPELRGLIGKMETLDNSGLFTRIFLRELYRFGFKFPRTATEKDFRETKDFAEFLFRIAEKGRDKEVPLDFEGETIKVSIVLVARREKAIAMDVGPYNKAISFILDRRIRTIYILATGSNIILGEKISAKLKKEQRLVFVKSNKYQIRRDQGETYKAYWAIFRSTLSI